MVQLSDAELRARVDRLKSSDPIRWKKIENQSAAMAAALQAHLFKELTPIVLMLRDAERRIAKLEGRADAKHLGPFESGRSYKVGNIVTHRGLDWRASRPTYDPPGVSECWEQHVREDADA